MIKYLATIDAKVDLELQLYHCLKALKMKLILL